jgi:hypothetical protein
VRVRVGDITSACGHSEKVWSDNGKWSGTESRHHLTVRPTWRTIRKAMRVVEGLLILEAKKSGDSWNVRYVHQSRGVSIESRAGVVTIDEDGDYVLRKVKA